MMLLSPIKGNFNTIESYETNIPAHTSDNGRYYEVRPGVYYPSITTVLGESVDLSGWIARVGQVEADKIKNQAAEHGTKVHDLIERYLKNEDIFLRNEWPLVKYAFKTGRKTIDNITKLDMLESTLWSDELKVAGRVDCIGEYLNVPSIIDFKTSSKIKKKEWIENYFCQATAYSKMYKERFGIDIKQIVIIIFVLGLSEPQVFIENCDNYINTLCEKITNFKGVFL